MYAEAGHIALCFALVVAVLQAALPMWGAQRGDRRLMAFGDRAATAQLALLTVAWVALTASFIASDFSVELAARHSHTQKPLVYKISGVWGNHEGSMLLWVVILALFGAMVAAFGRALPQGLRARALSVQGAIGAGFLAFLLFTSNPFARLSPAPAEGLGLNPVLQDPGLAVHPPLLYIGYVGFSVAFSFAVAALLEGRVDAVWARWLRPWVLVAWSFLTLGITVGSIWAYYELGWGGWWVWDPVENVSFLPWLAGTALLHSILTLQQRHSLAHWTVLLAISTFSLAMIGTFVVRSGVLVSVHAFAVDPTRGVVILALILLFTGAALGLYALRSRTLMSPSRPLGVGRETGLVLNNLLLVAATAIVFLGTFYPLFIEAVSRDKISVGAPYYDIVFTPVMLLLIAFMGVAPLLKWRGDSLARHRGLLLRLLLASLVVAALTAWLGRSVLGALAYGLAAWLALGTLATLHRRAGGSWARLRRQPAGLWGFALAHLGVAVFTAGVTTMSLGAQDSIARIKPGDSLQVAGHTFRLDDVVLGRNANYQFRRGLVSVTKDGRAVTRLSTEQRYYPARETVTSEAGFRVSPGTVLFAAIGDMDDTGAVLRAYYQPGIVWIWVGALMMALAGFVSLADGRLRLPSRDPALSAAPRQPVPAE